MFLSVCGGEGFLAEVHTPCVESGLPGAGPGCVGRVGAGRAGSGRGVKWGARDSSFRVPPSLSRSLVDTVYALKDEVQELRQVSCHLSVIV